MKSFIKDITAIRTGLFAKPSDSGNIVYLQSKHFDENGLLQKVLHPDLDEKGISEKHLLRHGDILFAAKGAKNFATVFEDHNEAAVASTSFFVISITNANLLPQYLAWFLNHPATQLELKGKAKGTAMPSISKQTLGDLQISIPDIPTQSAILAIASLRTREKSLRQQMEQLRDKQIQQQIFNAIQ